MYFLFDLSALDLEILLLLVKINPKSITLESLSEKTNREKNTVFRSLQRLVNQRIVSKETRTLKEREDITTYMLLWIKKVSG